MKKRLLSNDIQEEESEELDHVYDIPFNLKNYDEYLLTKDL